jgi:hypothetical protein
MRKWIELFEQSSLALQYIEAVLEKIGTNVEVRLSALDSQEVELEHIEATVPKMGYGSAAMKIICELADKFDITLTLGVANDTDDFYDTTEGMSEDDLIRFYSEWGFEEDEVGFGDERVYMSRSPL